jgi:hypothetical protein
VELVAEFLAQQLEALGVDVARHHRCALREEPAGDRLADA